MDVPDNPRRAKSFFAAFSKVSLVVGSELAIGRAIDLRLAGVVPGSDLFLDLAKSLFFVGVLFDFDMLS